MNERTAMARVLDAQGKALSPCSHAKARKLLAQGEAALISEEPLTIQLPYSVDRSAMTSARRDETTRLESGSRVLLHICCGPCGTYPLKWLQEQGYAVTGLWYNPNIHPWQEHEKRRASAESYATAVGLEMIWAESYEMPRFFRLVAGHERFRERCLLCYRLRLEWTARIASRREFDAFTTTLLISPHQDQQAIRTIGETLSQRIGIPFLFENFRRGWAERSQLTREHALYCQQYCGCIYSEWERYNKQPVDVLLDEVNWIWSQGETGN